MKLVGKGSAILYGGRGVKVISDIAWSNQLDSKHDVEIGRMWNEMIINGNSLGKQKAF